MHVFSRIVLVIVLSARRARARRLRRLRNRTTGATRSWPPSTRSRMRRSRSAATRSASATSRRPAPSRMISSSARATCARRRGRRPRRLPGRGFQPAVEQALCGPGGAVARPARGQTLDAWRRGRDARGRSARLARPDALRAHGAVDRSGARARRGSAGRELRGAGCTAGRLDAAFRQGLASLRAAGDRHQPCRVRIPRRSATASSRYRSRASRPRQSRARATSSGSSLVEASGATTVFFESLVSPKLAETVAREAGATTAVLNPLEGLTRRGARADGADYFSVMRENLAALRKALGCR